jgi:hypothetical protein
MQIKMQIIVKVEFINETKIVIDKIFTRIKMKEFYGQRIIGQDKERKLN